MRGSTHCRGVVHDKCNSTNVSRVHSKSRLLLCIIATIVATGSRSTLYTQRNFHRFRRMLERFNKISENEPVRQACSPRFRSSRSLLTTWTGFQKDCCEIEAIRVYKSCFRSEARLLPASHRLLICISRQQSCSTDLITVWQDGGADCREEMEAKGNGCKWKRVCTEAGRATTVHRECNYEYIDEFIEPPDWLDLARGRLYHNARARTGSKRSAKFDANTKCVEIVDYRRHTSDCFATDRFVSENCPSAAILADIRTIDADTALSRSDHDIMPRLIRYTRSIYISRSIRPYFSTIPF